MNECKPPDGPLGLNSAQPCFVAPVRTGAEQDQAKQKLARKLETLDELKPLDFERVCKLGCDLIDGDLRKLEEAVGSYMQRPMLLYHDVRLLARAFAGSGVEFLDTTVFKTELGQGQFRDMAIMSVHLKQAMRILTISTIPSMESCVYSIATKIDGCSVMELKTKEEPRLLAKQIGGVLCVGALPGPPPMSIQA